MSCIAGSGYCTAQPTLEIISHFNLLVLKVTWYRRLFWLTPDESAHNTVPTCTGRTKINLFIERFFVPIILFFVIVIICISGFNIFI